MENLKLEKEFLIRWNVITQLEFVYVTRIGAFCYCCRKCFQIFHQQTKQQIPFRSYSLPVFIPKSTMQYELSLSVIVQGYGIGMITSFAASITIVSLGLRFRICWESPKFLHEQFSVLSLCSKVMMTMTMKQKTGWIRGHFQYKLYQSMCAQKCFLGNLGCSPYRPCYAKA